MTSGPRVEVMNEPGDDSRSGLGSWWAWACYGCGAERFDYPSLLAAERDADEHKANCAPEPPAAA